jgi:hypothetical protein
MNRKLHNTAMALIASSSLFVLGLLTASPSAALVPPPASTAAVPFDAEHAVAVEAAEAVDDTVEPAEATPHRRIRRASRQSVAMPFFSFAPRG